MVAGRARVFRLPPKAAKSFWHHALEDLLARAARTACLMVGTTPPGAALRNRELRSPVARVRSAGGARQDRTGASEGRGCSRLGPPRQDSGARRGCRGFLSHQPGPGDPEALDVHFPGPEAATGLTGVSGGLGSRDFPTSQSLCHHSTH